MARLVQAVLSAHQHDSRDVTLFSDSTIVLSWIAKPSSTWRVFIANRVSKIHAAFPAIYWHHVAEEDNPADLATRGISAEDLTQADLWWSGPTFLQSVDV